MNKPDPVAKFRDAVNADIPKLAEMNEQLIQDERHRSRLNQAELRVRMQQWLAEEYDAVLFESNHVPIGYCLYRVEAESVYLRQFFVMANHRRRGIGRSALEWLFANRWQDRPRVRLDVLTTNSDAVRFWRSVGFADYCIVMEREVTPSPQSPK